MSRSRASAPRRRLFARVSGVFGAVALALACVGLYGLMSFMVVRRTGEIGVRMALGARPRQVLRLVLRESLALVMLGTLLGGRAGGARADSSPSLLFGLGARRSAHLRLCGLGPRRGGDAGVPGSRPGAPRASLRCGRCARGVGPGRDRGSR